jgi:hypothetical protein
MFIAPRSFSEHPDHRWRSEPSVARDRCCASCAGWTQENGYGVHRISDTTKTRTHTRAQATKRRSVTPAIKRIKASWAKCGPMFTPT